MDNSLFFIFQFYFIDFSVDCLSERGKAKGVYPGMFLLLSLNSCPFFSPLPLLSVFHDWCMLLCPVLPFVLFLLLDKRFMSCCHFAFLCFQWFIFVPKIRAKKFEEQMWDRGKKQKEKKNVWNFYLYLKYLSNFK